MSEKVELPLACLVCEMRPEPAFRDGDREVPHGATLFTTHGHYGSTVFDEMGGRELMLVVCDDCLRARADRLAIMTSWTPPRKHVFSSWDPEVEAER